MHNVKNNVGLKLNYSNLGIFRVMLFFFFFLLMECWGDESQVQLFRIVSQLFCVSPWPSSTPRRQYGGTSCSDVSTQKRLIWGGTLPMS